MPAHTRKVPDRDRLAHLLDAGMTVAQIATKVGVKTAAVRLHVVRYGLVECRTRSVRLAEALQRATPQPRPRKDDVRLSNGVITFTREFNVGGNGFQLRPLSLPAPEMYVAQVATRYPQLQGGVRV